MSFGQINGTFILFIVIIMSLKCVTIIVIFIPNQHQLHMLGF